MLINHRVTQSYDDQNECPTAKLLAILSAEMAINLHLIL